MGINEWTYNKKKVKYVKRTNGTLTFKTNIVWIMADNGTTRHT